jgi:hypothetical protein
VQEPMLRKPVIRFMPGIPCALGLRGMFAQRNSFAKHIGRDKLEDSNKEDLPALGIQWF